MISTGKKKYFQREDSLIFFGRSTSLYFVGDPTALERGKSVRLRAEKSRDFVGLSAKKKTRYYHRLRWPTNFFVLKLIQLFSPYQPSEGSCSYASAVISPRAREKKFSIEARSLRQTTASGK